MDKYYKLDKKFLNGNYWIIFSSRNYGKLRFMRNICMKLKKEN